MNSAYMKCFTRLHGCSRHFFTNNTKFGWKWMTTAATNGTSEEKVKTSEIPLKAEEANDATETDAARQELLAKLEKDVTELKDKYLRSLAETENVRQRLQKQVSDAKLFGVQSLCKDLLEVADILNTAIDSVPRKEVNNSNPHLKNLFEGLTMTGTQLNKVFNKHKLVAISPQEGDKFDPFYHEAMFEVPTQEPKDGQIAVITKIGYQLHDRTLRPALVGVFKAK